MSKHCKSCGFKESKCACAEKTIPTKSCGCPINKSCNCAEKEACGCPKGKCTCK